MTRSQTNPGSAHTSQAFAAYMPRHLPDHEMIHFAAPSTMDTCQSATFKTWKGYSFAFKPRFSKRLRTSQSGRHSRTSQPAAMRFSSDGPVGWDSWSRGTHPPAYRR